MKDRRDYALRSLGDVAVTSETAPRPKLKLRESDLPTKPVFIRVRRIIGDWRCSLH
jgi:hypothetical protein